MCCFSSVQEHCARAPARPPGRPPPCLPAPAPLQALHGSLHDPLRRRHVRHHRRLLQHGCRTYPATVSTLHRPFRQNGSTIVLLCAVTDPLASSNVHTVRRSSITGQEEEVNLQYGARLHARLLEDMHRQHTQASHIADCLSFLAST